jgi:hypothetical protein
MSQFSGMKMTLEEADRPGFRFEIDAPYQEVPLLHEPEGFGLAGYVQYGLHVPDTRNDRLVTHVENAAGHRYPYTVRFLYFAIYHLSARYAAQVKTLCEMPPSEERTEQLEAVSTEYESIRAILTQILETYYVLYDNPCFQHERAMLPLTSYTRIFAADLKLGRILGTKFATSQLELPALLDWKIDLEDDLENFFKRAMAGDIIKAEQLCHQLGIDIEEVISAGNDSEDEEQEASRDGRTRSASAMSVVAEPEGTLRRRRSSAVSAMSVDSSSSGSSLSSLRQHNAQTHGRNASMQSKAWKADPDSVLDCDIDDLAARLASLNGRIDQKNVKQNTTKYYAFTVARLGNFREPTEKDMDAIEAAGVAVQIGIEREWKVRYARVTLATDERESIPALTVEGQQLETVEDLAREMVRIAGRTRLPPADFYASCLYAYAYQQRQRFGAEDSVREIVFSDYFCSGVPVTIITMAGSKQPLGLSPARIDHSKPYSTCLKERGNYEIENVDVTLSNVVGAAWITNLVQGPGTQEQWQQQLDAFHEVLSYYFSNEEIWGAGEATTNGLGWPGFEEAFYREADGDSDDRERADSIAEFLDELTDVADNPRRLLSYVRGVIWPELAD